ncbi:hypothetical protein COL154_007108 [Colletotrichum chrysophilum]|nr:hypothetical protein KNSL1_004521 [Colletotrichum chrysophilum]KAJ0361053.1 hypothetical protein COL154_007108 [Colletotrichum chrysophilum]
MAAANDGFGDLGLDIIGVGTQYPPHSLEANSIDYLSEMYYPESPAMKKILSINRFTGIEYRSSIGTPEHPIVNQKNPPSITDLHNVFMSDGVPLAVSASRKAIEEADIDLSEITHIVATTCTDSANPGFDHYVIKGLGMTHQVEKVLLHGVGCSGGLASLRTAANLALGHKFRGKPARILCVALEVSTTLVRSELDSINETQETRIGVALFSDCASAVVLSNGIGQPATPVYSLLGWEHKIIPDTEGDLGFDVDPVGPRYQKADDFDWAMHPGGATILTEAEKAMNISSFHMRASYDTYMKHGNSSSATIFSVMDRLRSKDMDDIAPEGRARDYVVGCAFGPGIAVEMCMLKRNLGARDITGLETPPETESEGSSRSEAGDDGGAQMEGHTSPGRDGGQSFVAEALENLELD